MANKKPQPILENANAEHLISFLQENQDKSFIIFCPKLWSYEENKLTEGILFSNKNFALKYKDNKILTKGLLKSTYHGKKIKNEWSETSICPFGIYNIYQDNEI